MKIHPGILSRYELTVEFIESYSVANPKPTLSANVTTKATPLMESSVPGGAERAGEELVKIIRKMIAKGGITCHQQHTQDSAPAAPTDG